LLDGVIGADKSDDPLWLLERLNQPVQQNPLKTATMPIDAVFVVTGTIHDPFYFPGPTSGFGLGFAVRTSPPPNTTWPLGEYRWDDAGGSFYFVDRQDDMLVICMVQAPTQSGRIQLALKTMLFEALGKGLRKD
jgi:CubicO group peptidase (beta-lactamase class C family)